MASAQLIFHPLDFQAESKCQVHHLSPIMILILKPELASEKALRSLRDTGPEMFLERLGIGDVLPTI